MSQKTLQVYTVTGFTHNGAVHVPGVVAANLDASCQEGLRLFLKGDRQPDEIEHVESYPEGVSFTVH